MPRTMEVKYLFDLTKLPIGFAGYYEENLSEWQCSNVFHSTKFYKKKQGNPAHICRVGAMMSA